MKLQIDFREKSVIELFDKEETDYRTEVLSLPVGDFVIKDELSEQLYCIIERKTMEDLSASIKDGRFREQKKRLLESVGQPHRVIYIIEGYKATGNKKLLPKDTLESAILNLSFKHDYKVVYTFDTDDTFYKLKKLYKKIRDKEYIFNGNSNVDTVDVSLISKTKKMNNNIFVNQLCVIPGVSMSIANCIVSKYSTMSGLLEHYNNCKADKERELMLVDITINEKRRIGKVLSKKIYISLFYSK